MRFVGFIGPSYTMKSLNVDCQRCINLFPELNELGTGKEKEVAALVGTPGIKTILTLPTSPFRGLKMTSKGRLFAVGGNKMYEISSTWIATELGTLATSTGIVSMDDDGYYLVAVDGSNGYQFSFDSNTFSQITDPNFLGGTHVAFLDGYFILNKPNTSGFYISTSVAERITLGDMTLTFPGEETAVDGNPDSILAVLADHRDLWMFNSNTIEIYYDSGGTDFPFARNPSGFIEHGLAAPFSVAKMNNTVFWLGRDDKGSGMIFQARGFQPDRISTHAIESEIQKYSKISDAVAYTYQEDGHHFYVLNFPTANKTWAFDSTTRLWHERAYLNQGKLDRHRANCHAFAFDKHVVGDWESGKLYEMSSAIHNDDGNEIHRKRTAPHITDGLTNLFFNSFQLDVESGVGLDGLGQGTDPKVILQFSDDGGHKWSNEKWASIGKIGDTKVRAKWNRLGRARDRVFSVTITDAVKVVILGAELDFTKGAS